MLPIIPQDKANHFAYGAAISVLAGVIAWHLSLPLVAFSVGAAVLFGAAKEAADWYRNRTAKLHSVEVADFLATVAGGAAVNALLVLSKG
jgi:hypothetical protein